MLILTVSTGDIQNLQSANMKLLIKPPIRFIIAINVADLRITIVKSHFLDHAFSLPPSLQKDKCSLLLRLIHYKCFTACLYARNITVLSLSFCVGTVSLLTWFTPRVTVLLLSPAKAPYNYEQKVGIFKSHFSLWPGSKSEKQFF